MQFLLFIAVHSFAAQSMPAKDSQFFPVVLYLAGLPFSHDTTYLGIRGSSTHRHAAQGTRDARASVSVFHRSELQPVLAAAARNPAHANE